VRKGKVKMISDVLSSATSEMNGYLAKFPGAYEAIEQPLNKLIVLMESVRECLDSPAKAGQDKGFWQALSELNIQPVTSALAAMRNFRIEQH
jgi:hypothetical protein